MGHLVDSQGKENGDGKTCNNAVNGNSQGIFYGSQKHIRIKKISKMFKPNPGAPQNTEISLIIFKSDDNTVHRFIDKKDQKNHRWGKEYIQAPINPYVSEGFGSFHYNNNPFL
jgi:hypothetical protein